MQHDQTYLPSIPQNTPCSLLRVNVVIYTYVTKCNSSIVENGNLTYYNLNVFFLYLLLLISI